MTHRRLACWLVGIACGALVACGGGASDDARGGGDGAGDAPPPASGAGGSAAGNGGAPDGGAAGDAARPDGGSAAPDAGDGAADGAPDASPSAPTAQSFAAALKLGVNIERANAYLMGDFGSGTTAYAYLKQLGFTHVRLFYAFRPTLDFGQSGGLGVAPTPAQFARVLDSAKNANAAGLRVLLDLTDVMGTEDFAGANQQLVDGYLDMASKQIAQSGLDPNWVAVGAVNEWAGADNATWNPQRKHVLDILRANLPGFVLTTGAAYWKYYENLLADDFELSQDPRVLYDIHAYEDAANDAQHWVDLASRVAAWSASHGGAQVIFGEAGFGNYDGGPSHYYNVMGAAADKGQSLHPTFWAITDGGAWRMNVSGADYHLDPALEYVMHYWFP